MQPDLPYKQCPACKQTMPLDAALCSQCGHTFRTKFAPPNQTQAFFPGGPGDPAQSPSPSGFQSYQQPPYVSYPRPNSSSDFFVSLLNGIPPFVCFIVGFFTNLLSLVLIVCYFGYAPTRDPGKGWATICGMLAPFAFWMIFFLVATFADRH